MLERQEGSWKCVATSFALAIGHLTQDLGIQSLDCGFSFHPNAADHHAPYTAHSGDVLRRVAFH